MLDQHIAASGAMEGKGAYNTSAKLQAAGGTSALPHLQHAARTVTLDPPNRPVVIADYGCSQGKNSFAPMRLAIDVVRSRVGNDRPILVYHVDLPANDFNALFDVLDTDPNRYAGKEACVYPCAIGRSFYEPVLPPDTVHLGWSSYAAMWISRIPVPMSEHIFVPCNNGAVREAFEQQGAHDWESFLSLRAAELWLGGQLVVAVPAANDAGGSGFEQIMDDANAVLAEMVADGAISAYERGRMVLGAWPRRRRDLLVPFQPNGRFRGLTVDQCETSPVPDPAWTAYQQDGDAEALAAKHAAFFRTTFGPTLASALGAAHDADVCHAFKVRLESGLKRRLARRPAPVNTLVETLVFTKLGAG